MQSLIKSIVTLSFIITGAAANAQDITKIRFSDYPLLSKSEREALDVQQLQGKTQPELDILYAQLSSGPLPDGAYQGFVVFDDSGESDIERILSVSVPPALENWVKQLGTKLWRGKTFNRETKTLTNRMGIVQRFPANVYCGQSLLDSRRESIVLDYAYGDSISGYIDALDWPMTRKGLSIRDEIRMVKPGLYLGRAYIRGLYALNFILYSEQEEQRGFWDDECKS